MKLKLFYSLERFFGWLELFAGERKECFSLCPDCKRNRYTGEPCK